MPSSDFLHRNIFAWLCVSYSGPYQSTGHDLVLAPGIGFGWCGVPSRVEHWSIRSPCKVQLNDAWSPLRHGFCVFVLPFRFSSRALRVNLLIRWAVSPRLSAAGAGRRQRDRRAIACQVWCRPTCRGVGSASGAARLRLVLLPDPVSIASSPIAAGNEIGAEFLCTTAQNHRDSVTQSIGQNNQFTMLWRLIGCVRQRNLCHHYQLPKSSTTSQSKIVFIRSLFRTH